METETTATVTETPTAPATAPTVQEHVDTLMDNFLGESDMPKEEISSAPANAPAEGNPKAPVKAPDAPTGEEPASLEAKPAGGATETPPVDPKAEEEDDESLINAFLDVDPAETSEDPSLWKGRYSDATRRINELNDQLKGVNEVLASQGRQIVMTKNGPKLAPTDDAAKLTAEAIDVGALITSLTPAERELFVDDAEQAARLVAEKTINQIAEKFTPAEVTKNDAVLSQADADAVYDDFLSCKLPDGKTARYPDADNATIKGLMERAYEANTPAMQKFREIAAKDKDMHHAMLEYLYNKVYRGRQAQLAMLAAKKKATSEAKERNEKEPTISSQGSSQAAAGQSASLVSQNESERIGGVVDEVLNGMG